MILLLRLSGLAVFLLAWELTGQALGAALLAPPSAVIAELITLAADPHSRPPISPPLAPAPAGSASTRARGLPFAPYQQPTE